MRAHVRVPICNADQVREYIARTRGAKCPRCRYCLDGLPSDVCPECGQRLSVREIVGATRYRRWWLMRHAMRWGCTPEGGVGLIVLIPANVIAAGLGMAVSWRVQRDLSPAVWLAPFVVGGVAYLMHYGFWKRCAGRGAEDAGRIACAIAGVVLLMQLIGVGIVCA